MAFGNTVRLAVVVWTISALSCGQASNERPGEAASAQRQSVEGEVQGRIAVDLGKDGYALFEGSDIDRVDSQGVLLTAGASVLSCTAPSRSMDPFIIIDALANSAPVGIASIDPGGEMLFVVRGYSGEPALHSGRVLGEYDPSGEKARIVPSLRIVNKAGVASIPVADLVIFTKSPTPAAD